MKRIFVLGVLLILLGVCLIYNKDIINFTITNVIQKNHVATEIVKNEYSSDKEYSFVKNTNNFEPHNKQDILNIFYTVLNAGMKSFTFYCPKDYKNCVDDVDIISNDQILLSNINNFVPVYNSFKNVETEFDTLGKVTIYIAPNYTDDQIKEIDNVVNEFIKNNIPNDITDENKIKIIHDYIINNTKYDVDRSDKKIKKYRSDTAYGALIEHYAICGGYADGTKIFLDKLGIENYKVSSENHIWNLVKVNDKWLHLDLTWDDPVLTDDDGNTTSKDALEYNYFLITTEQLHNLESDQHYFDKSIYKEAL